MENAQLIALSRQIGLQRQMDVVANNLANLNTTGFKAESILFDDYRSPVARDPDFAPADQALTFTQDWATLHDLSAGGVVTTGNPLDLAIDGDGFFAVETPEGERWTRSGALQINAEGTLVDLNGYPVLSDLGPIRFEPDETDITFAANGAIITSNGVRSRLRIAEFENPYALKREGDNLWSEGEQKPAENSRIVQGALERSNVSGVSEMAEMIRVQRSYQSVASLMQRQDELRRTAIQRLGDLSA